MNEQQVNIPTYQIHRSVFDMLSSSAEENENFLGAIQKFNEGHQLSDLEQVAVNPLLDFLSIHNIHGEYAKQLIEQQTLLLNKYNSLLLVKEGGFDCVADHQIFNLVTNRSVSVLDITIDIKNNSIFHLPYLLSALLQCQAHKIQLLVLDINVNFLKNWFSSNREKFDGVLKLIPNLKAFKITGYCGGIVRAGCLPDLIYIINSVACFCPDIESLELPDYIEYMLIDDAYFQGFIKALSPFQKLNALHISKTRCFSEQDFLKLGELLDQHPSIKTLNLTSSEVWKEEIVMLTDLIKTFNLSDLDFIDMLIHEGSYSDILRECGEDIESLSFGTEYTYNDIFDWRSLYPVLTSDRFKNLKNLSVDFQVNFLEAKEQEDALLLLIQFFSSRLDCLTIKGIGDSRITGGRSNFKVLLHLKEILLTENERVTIRHLRLEYFDFFHLPNEILHTFCEILQRTPLLDQVSINCSRFNVLTDEQFGILCAALQGSRIHTFSLGERIEWNLKKQAFGEDSNRFQVLDAILEKNLAKSSLRQACAVAFWNAYPNSMIEKVKISDGFGEVVSNDLFRITKLDEEHVIVGESIEVASSVVDDLKI